jgi:hypothetical protein
VLSVRWRVAAGASTHAATDAAAPLLALRTDTAFGVPVDACRLTLHGVAEVEAAPGDTVTVELGYADGMETVFTGSVTSVTHGLRRVEVEAAGTLAPLAAARLNLLYEEETAGGIAGDVLDRLEVPKGTVEAGIKLPAFALHDGASAWAQLAALARRAGFDLWSDVEGKAQFRACQPATTHELTFGTDLLDWRHEALAPAADGVEVHGESPAGQGQGDEAASWLTRQAVKGTAGKTSGRVLRVVDPAARTPQLAGDVAQGWLLALERTARGRATALGAPALKLGDALRVTGLPAPAQGAEARVTAVRHRLDPRAGFVTTLGWERR